MKYLAFLVVLAIPVSCTKFSSRPVAGALSRQCSWPTVVFCDPSLSERSCEAVQTAVEWWNQRLLTNRAFFVFGGTRSLNPASPPGQVYVAQDPKAKPLDVFSRNPVPLAVTAFVPHLESMCRAQAVVVLLVRDTEIADGSLEQVYKHELGHVLGLPHATGRACLMYPNQDIASYDSQMELCDAEYNLLRALYAP